MMLHNVDEGSQKRKQKLQIPFTHSIPKQEVNKDFSFFLFAVN